MDILTDGEGADDFELFVAGMQAGLQRSAWLLTGSWEEAEDLVQTSLVKVWRNWNRVAVAENPKAHVRKVLTNSFLSVRRRRWHTEDPQQTVEPSPMEDPADTLALRATLLAALAELSPRQRAVIVLRYFDDLSEAQTAAAMGRRLGTVKSTTAKALERLRNVSSLVRQLLMRI